jgi:hypothetical protein
MTDYSTLLREALNHGFPIEPALAALRERGATLIDCVKAVREVQNLSLAEAKQLVDDSGAYRDLRS